jgi:hypothetical protein
MARIPKAASRVLDKGVLCYVAVHTSHGPHLTPMVYALHAGRLWVTTSRGSVKGRAWRVSPEVAGVVRHGNVAVTFRGQVSTYDALDPFSWPRSVLSGPRLARAGAKFSLKNARFFAGYAVDANKVPLSWSPPGRVFAAINLAAGWLIDETNHRVQDGWGEWGRRGVSYRKEFSALRSSKGGGLDIPESVRAEVGDEGTGAIALEGSEGELTVVPATWRRRIRERAYEAVVPAAWLDLANARQESRAALTADHLSTWRAADMTGLLAQGPAQLYSPAQTTTGGRALAARLGASTPDLALVRLRPDRLVWWRGWTSGTVTAMSGAAR